MRSSSEESDSGDESVGDGSHTSRRAGLKQKLLEDFRNEVLESRCLAAATGVAGPMPVTLGVPAGNVRQALRRFMYGAKVLKAGSNGGPHKHKLETYRDDMLLLTRETELMREYTVARRMADLDRFQRQDPVEEEEEEEQHVKAAKDEGPQATLGVLSQINLLRDAALPGTHNWMQYSVLSPQLPDPRSRTPLLKLSHL